MSDPFLSFLQDLLQAMFSGLLLRIVSSAAPVQTPHSPLGDPSQPQRGASVGLLGVGHPAGAYVLLHPGAGGRGRRRRYEPALRHQGRGGAGHHLHTAAAAEGGACSPPGAGHHHLTAGTCHLPEHLHHLHLYIHLPLLRGSDHDSFLTPLQKNKINHGHKEAPKSQMTWIS